MFPNLCRPQIPDVSPLDGYTAGQIQQGGPAGSYALSSLETLNTANGQLSITIPVVTVHGRGSVSVQLSVNLTPPIWDVTANSYEYDCGTYSCTIGWLYDMIATCFLAAAPFSAGQFVFRSSGDQNGPVNGSSSRWNNVLTRGTFVAANGTETEFVDQQTNGTPESRNLTGSVDLLIDGEDVTTIVPSAYMYALSRSLSQRRQYLNGTLVAETNFQSSGEIDSYDGSGNLLAKETQTIASAGTLPGSGTNYNPPQYNQRTAANYYDAGGSTLLESQALAYYQPSNCKVNCPTIETLTTTLGSWVKKSTYTYDQYNNVKAETDSDWGTNGSPGGTLRVTDTTYNTSSGIINDNILGLPATVKVCDGSNNLYTSTQYSYDSTSIANDPGISGTYHDNTNSNSRRRREVHGPGARYGNAERFLQRPLLHSAADALS
jgi:hypothetical protein